jgi:5-methylcytosine-specific restriction endonuclease McrA
MAKKKVPRELERQVHKISGFRCVYCGRGGPSFEGWLQLTVDHFVPTSLGGPETELSNLKTACHVCNVMKGDKPYTSVEDASRKLKPMWEQMRRNWEQDYRSLIDAEGTT